jgi:hypothetical protein
VNTGFLAITLDQSVCVALLRTTDRVVNWVSADGMHGGTGGGVSPLKSSPPRKWLAPLTPSDGVKVNAESGAAASSASASFQTGADDDGGSVSSTVTAATRRPSKPKQSLSLHVRASGLCVKVLSSGGPGDRERLVRHPLFTCTLWGAALAALVKPKRLQVSFKLTDLNCQHSPDADADGHGNVDGVSGASVSGGGGGVPGGVDSQVLTRLPDTYEPFLAVDALASTSDLSLLFGRSSSSSSSTGTLGSTTGSHKCVVKVEVSPLRVAVLPALVEAIAHTLAVGQLAAYLRHRAANAPPARGPGLVALLLGASPTSPPPCIPHYNTLLQPPLC